MTSAMRQPETAASAIIAAGATADPRWPAKVWTLKARPMRAGLI